MDSPLVGPLQTAKGFWKTKDGKWGLAFLVPIGAGSLWLLGKILPFLIILTQNLITLIGLVVCLGVIVFMSVQLLVILQK